ACRAPRRSPTRAGRPCRAPPSPTARRSPTGTRSPAGRSARTRAPGRRRPRSRAGSGRRLDQGRQVRVECIAPARPVVRVADLGEPRRVTLLLERAGDGAVVGAILLAGTDRDPDGDRPVAFAAAKHRADEARDPPVAREPGLVRIPAP